MKPVIELVKTSFGYAVVEKGEQVNKVHQKSTKEKTPAVSKKFVQQNFTIYPYLYTQEVDAQKKYIILPAKSQWFNFAQVHEIEKKALPEWFKTRKIIFGAPKPDKFEKNEDLYKKYRNYIIDLGKDSYVTQTRARKGLAGDACAIMRIHNFLEKWGLINYMFPQNIQTSLPSPRDISFEPKLRKDCIDKDKTIFEKHFDKDYLELLKKITKKYRPLCHICEGVCGIIWYEYTENLVLKHVEPVKLSNDQIRNQITASDESFPYMLRLCASCLCSGNLPVIFSIENFEKKNLFEELEYFYEEPKEKRKSAEQNKMLEVIERNKFNLKKSAQVLKMTEEQIYRALIFIPLTKIEKMARIDAETQAEETKNGGEFQMNEMEDNFKNGISEEEEQTENDLLKMFLQKKEKLNEEEIVLYEELIQRWLVKISAKVSKLSEWQKGTKWFGSRLVANQKNNLAENLRKSQAE